MTLKFTAKALEDLERLHEFVAEKNPAAADRTRDHLLASFQTLLEQPMGGKPVKSLPVRQWVAGDYVIRYLIDSEHSLIIVRIWHGREDRPA
ncbi:MAG: type II toxin-antitoxin system RelE/ParE family toxin [Halioglobus sp.]